MWDTFVMFLCLLVVMFTGLLSLIILVSSMAKTIHPEKHYSLGDVFRDCIWWAVSGSIFVVSLAILLNGGP